MEGGANCRIECTSGECIWGGGGGGRQASSGFHTGFFGNLHVLRLLLGLQTCWKLATNTCKLLSIKKYQDQTSGGGGGGGPNPHFPLYLRAFRDMVTAVYVKP